MADQHKSPEVGMGPPKDAGELQGAPREEVGFEGVPLEPTTFRLDEETRAFLQEEAKRLGVSESEVARQVFAFYRGWTARERAGEREQES